jgi:GntR family transcriptional regulator
MNQVQPMVVATDQRPLNSASPVPLYHQIVQEMKQRIERGELAPGMPLPSERELCDQYGVSRPTVRQATQELINEGLLERRRGVGTYVAQPKIQHQLGSVLGFSERMQREGRQPSARVLEHMICAAADVNDEIRTQLGLALHTRVLRLVRLRLADDEPLLIETVHLPLDRFPGLDQVNFGTRSLYRTLRESFGVEITQLRETLEPVVLKPSDALLLDTEAGRPAMLTRITTYDQTGQVLECTFSLARADRCQYYIEFNVGERPHAGAAHLRQTQFEISLPA